MSAKEKLIERFKRLPADFTFDELVRVFELYGFHIDNKGRTSGSRVSCHKPHPTPEMKKVALKEAYNYLFYKKPI